MTIVLLTISFIVDEAYSLKDKRRIVKSIIHKAQDRYKVSSAEVDYQDIINQSEIAFVMVSNNYRYATTHLEKLLYFIEETYPIQINEYKLTEI